MKAIEVQHYDTLETWEARNELEISELWSITTGEGEMDNPLEVFTENLYDIERNACGVRLAQQSLTCGGSTQHTSQKYFSQAVDILGSDRAHDIREFKLAELKARYPQGWAYFPGDTCRHGVYVNTDYDIPCARCEYE